MLVHNLVKSCDRRSDVDERTRHGSMAAELANWSLGMRLRWRRERSRELGCTLPGREGGGIAAAEEGGVKWGTKGTGRERGQPVILFWQHLTSIGTNCVSTVHLACKVRRCMYGHPGYKFNF